MFFRKKCYKTCHFHDFKGKKIKMMISMIFWKNNIKMVVMIVDMVMSYGKC